MYLIKMLFCKILIEKNTPPSMINYNSTFETIEGDLALTQALPLFFYNLKAWRTTNVLLI